MKMYALVYTYKIKKEKDDGDFFIRDMTRLHHSIGESLEDVMLPVEKEIKKEKGYVDYSINLNLRSIVSLDEILDDIKVKLPELVQNAKQREKLTKVAEVLNDYDNKS